MMYDFFRSFHERRGDPPSTGTYWLAIFGNLAAHLPFILCAHEYLQKRCGFENCFCFVWAISSMLYYTTVMSVKYEVMHLIPESGLFVKRSEGGAYSQLTSVGTAGPIDPEWLLLVDTTSDYYMRTPPSVRRELLNIIFQKVWGLTLYQWRALQLFFMVCNFLFLLLVCTLQTHPTQNRFYHGLIVFGNLVLFIDHTQLSSERKMSERMLSVVFFGLFVVIKRIFEGENSAQTLNPVPRLKGWAVPTTLMAWGWSMVFNILSALFEDQDTAVAQPLLLIWVCVTAFAFYLTVCLTAKARKNYNL